MLFYLVTFKTLHNNLTNFSNKWTQEVKCAESSVTIFSNEWNWGWNMLLVIVTMSLLLKTVLFLTDTPAACGSGESTLMYVHDNC